MAIYKRGKTFHTDVTVSGIRYRESLETTNWQEAQRLEKEFIARALAGKAAPPTGKGSFASLPMEQALAEFVKGRVGRVAERTSQVDRERSKPIVRHMGTVLVRKIDAARIRDYQDARKAEGSVSGCTINMEVFLIRQVLKRAKRWAVIADDVHSMPENRNAVGRVMTKEEKLKLFRTASSKPSWLVAYCAAVIAVSTTCRKVEILNLRWVNADLFARVIQIGRSKTAAGHRTIPLNADAMEAFARLRQRAEALGGGGRDQYIFPACENEVIDFTKPQKSIRTAWRNIVKAAGMKGLRVHDLRHQAITELSEGGASDATMMAVSGHLSRKMLEHYSHVRMAAKRTAIDALGGGLMQSEALAEPVTNKPS
jgi:integrase